MKILNSSARITEIADTAKQLVMLYKSETALANDPILKPVFTQVESLTEKLSQSIK